MEKTFFEIKLFQVKPDRFEEFEKLVAEMKEKQVGQTGCVAIKYFKRFYTINGVELGQPPRELTRIVKCVKYYSCWEFDNKENYGVATKWFFDNYYKKVMQFLIMPFDINIGDTL